MTIVEIAAELRLPYTHNNSQMLLDEAKHVQMGHEEFLTRLLEGELELRRENGVKNRLRYAKFPYRKYLEDFDVSKYEPEIRSKFNELNTLNFIKEKENIILIGSPGSGKSHYSIGLGIRACMEGMKVLFISVPNLIIELKEAMSLNQLNNYKKKFEKL